MASTTFVTGTIVQAAWLNATNTVVYGVGSTTGQILTSTGDGTAATWQDATVATLNDLTDVTITAVASGDYLRYSGSAWVNVTNSQIITDINATLDHGTLAGLTDDDHTQYLLADGSRALSADWNAGSQTITNLRIVTGEPGAEGTGVTVSGATYNAHLKSSDINDSDPAHLHLHRHSLTLPPLWLTSRSHSAGSSHTIVSNGDGLGTWYAVGWDGTDYAFGGAQGFFVDGTPGSNDMPTRWALYTSADGTENLTERLRITSAGAWGLAGANYGTAAQVLTSNGSAAAPTWQDAATGAGASKDITQASHGFAVGDLIYYTGSAYAKAVASAASTAEVVGIVSAVADTSNFTLLFIGEVTGLSGLTAGSVYFLDPSTAGAMTATEPTTTGYISKPVFVATSTTAGYFFNYRGTTVGSATSTLAQDIQSGDGSTTAFTLPAAPVSENNVLVFISGVWQQRDTYSVSGTTLTFSTAPPSGTNNIEFIVIGSVSVGQVASSERARIVANHTLSASVGSSALTIALKDHNGSDPSASSPVSFSFPDGSGGFTDVDVTAATSLTISSGSTLGTASGAVSRIWIVGFNDGGTFRLGAINCHSANYTADAMAYIKTLNEHIPASSTAEGGAGGADSGQTFYTGASVTSKYYVILGYVESTQTTAGTWATSPSTVMAWREGMPRPGDVIQRVCNTTLASLSTTSTSPVAWTNGSATLTANSAANVIRVRASHNSYYSLVGATNVAVYARIYRDSTGINTTHSVYAQSAGGGEQASGDMAHETIVVPASTSAIAYAIYGWISTASSTHTGAGGFISAEEIMG